MTKPSPHDWMKYLLVDLIEYSALNQLEMTSKQLEVTLEYLGDEAKKCSRKELKVHAGAPLGCVGKILQ